MSKSNFEVELSLPQHRHKCYKGYISLLHIYRVQCANPEVTGRIYG